VRTLYVLRHAKSSWNDPTIPDHDRPLAPRGRRATKVITKYMIGRGITPELVLCSSAVRARETLAGIERALGPYVEVRVEDQLYGASGGALLRRLHLVGDHVTSVMLIAHNPGLGDLAVGLVGTGGRRLLTKLADGLPTAALVVIRLSPDKWSDIGWGDAELVDFALPRELA
jgi:phosphohistidine phosphatase